MIDPYNTTIIIPFNESITPMFYIFSGTIYIIFICWTCIRCYIYNYHNLLLESSNEQEYANAENNIDLVLAEREVERERTKKRVTFESNNIKPTENIIDDRNLPSYCEVYI